jgi:hypothetical protein
VIWLSWRRQRTETFVAGAILALLVLLLLPSGLEMAHAYHRDGLGSCLAATTSDACDQAVSSFMSRFSSISDFIAWFTLIPGLIGVLLAAPFVLELEQGTHRLAWTQSVTRGRWIATKLGLAVSVAALAALVFTLLVTWWRTPLVHLQGRMDQSVFDSEGIVVFGYTLFALGLATAVGVVWRRGVAAVVVGFAGYFAARIFVDTWLRQRLLSPLHARWPLMSPDPAFIRRGWVLNEYPSNRFGHRGVPLAVCPPPRILGDKASAGDCLARHGYVMNAIYEPASRFWALQGIETSLFLGAAALLLAFAAWWTYRRAA